MRATLVYAPHPDDEVLYTAGYIASAAAPRGDLLILVAVSNGDGTGMKPADWTTKTLVNVRVAEQRRAWQALCQGTQNLEHRLGYKDASDSLTLAEVQAGVADFARAMERAYAGYGVEHYVAGGYLSSQSQYHQSVAAGVRDAGVKVARFTKMPDDSHTANGYRPTPGSPAYLACEQAADAYRAFGNISVPSVFSDLRASGYLSRVYP